MLLEAQRRSSPAWFEALNHLDGQAGFEHFRLTLGSFAPGLLPEPAAAALADAITVDQWPNDLLECRRVLVELMAKRESGDTHLVAQRVVLMTLGTRIFEPQVLSGFLALLGSSDESTSVEAQRQLTRWCWFEAVETAISEMFRSPALATNARHRLKLIQVIAHAQPAREKERTALFASVLRDDYSVPVRRVALGALYKVAERELFYRSLTAALLTDPSEFIRQDAVQCIVTDAARSTLFWEVFGSTLSTIKDPVSPEVRTVLELENLGAAALRGILPEALYSKDLRPSELRT